MVTTDEDLVLRGDRDTSEHLVEAILDNVTETGHARECKTFGPSVRTTTTRTTKVYTGKQKVYTYEA